MRVEALAIALGCGFLTLGILGRGQLRQPWLLAALVGGAAVFPITLTLVNPIQALLASMFGWDANAYSATLGVGLAGVVITALLNEVFKLAPALLAWSASRERNNALAFGAAAGAGFAVVGAHQVLQLALIARTLPISSAAGFASALVQQFAFIVVNAATTALAAYGARRHRIIAYLLVAIAAESVFSALGLLFSLRTYSGTIWTLAAAAVGLALLAYTFTLSLAPRVAEGPSAAS